MARIAYKINNLIDSINRVIHWLPIIWKDKDWDYAFLLKIMQYKLSRMASSLEKGPTVSGPSEAKKIRIVCQHIDRYLNEPWLDIIDHIEAQPVKDPPIKVSMPCFVRVPVYKKYVLFPRAQEEHSEELRRWHWNRIWCLIDQYGKGWWD